ncbi:MAG: hypothetical protein AAF721_32055 [Myxococcota bacterium]
MLTPTLPPFPPEPLPSSKRYAREFYRRARARLAPNGVMTFWLEHSYSVEVVETIVATVRAEFEHCALAALNAGYLQVVCGNAPLLFVGLTDEDLTPALRAALARRFDPDEFLRRAPSLFFDRVAMLEHPPAVRLNTLDLPVLEFAKTSHRRPTAALAVTMGIDFDSQPGRGPLSLDERRDRCGDLEHMFGGMPGCATGRGH